MTLEDIGLFTLKIVSKFTSCLCVSCLVACLVSTSKPFTPTVNQTALYRSKSSINTTMEARGGCLLSISMARGGVDYGNTGLNLL